MEEKYETDTKGEHSGRCCKYFDGCDIENAIAENGYIILTDYGRFKGSRAANVEAHGGASLEETVIPLITLSLRNSTDVSVKVLSFRASLWTDIAYKDGVGFVMVSRDSDIAISSDGINWSFVDSGASEDFNCVCIMQ